MPGTPNGSRRRDRRTEIAGAVIDVIAEQGVRSLTHRAVDRALDLPPGSTSYYFRTRRALLEAAVVELSARARADFVSSGLRQPPAGAANEAILGTVAGAIGAYVERLVVARRAETLARYALTFELQGDAELSSMLVPGPFSVEAAGDLLAALGAPAPDAAGRGLVSLLEGLVLERTGRIIVAPDARPITPDPGSLAFPIACYLRGAMGPSS